MYKRQAFYPSSKPCARWWWFATEIKKPDIKYQLDWAKENNFGGVEIAWVFPLYRYQKMYARSYGRHYPKDTSAQKWLSSEWSYMVSYAKSYSDSIGLSCDFTFGSAWPVAGSNMTDKMDYASAGVDIDLEGSAVASLISSLGKSVRPTGTPGAPVDLPGGFGGSGNHRIHFSLIQ